METNEKKPKVQHNPNQMAFEEGTLASLGFDPAKVNQANENLEEKRIDHGNKENA